MILAIDIGNTNIKIGLFNDNALVGSWRLASDVSRTADEYGATIKLLMNINNVPLSKINGAIMSSVIPQLNYTVSHAVSYYFGVNPIIVSPSLQLGMAIKYSNPHELGTDRIINCVGALSKYKPPFVVIDFGTATSYNVVNRHGEFEGGLIALGVKSGMEALASSAAKLPRVEIVKPDSIIASSTHAAMQSGTYFGMVGQVGYAAQAIRRELGEDKLMVIGTGGLAELFKAEHGLIDVVDRTLSLHGLNIIYSKNS